MAWQNGREQGGMTFSNPDRVYTALTLGAVVFFSGAFPAWGQAGGKVERASKLRTGIAKASRLIQSDPDAAVAILRQLVKSYPEEEVALLEKLGLAYFRAGRPDSAKLAYESCIRLDPLRPAPVGALAKVYIDLGEKEQAEELLEEMVQRAPRKLSAYSVVASVQSGAGWYDRALETYRKGRQVSGDPSAFSIEIGDLEKLKGNLEGALIEYLGSLRARPSGDQAKRKILALLKHAGSSRDRLFGTLAESALNEKNPEKRKRMKHILSLAYLECGILGKALDIALDADRTAGSDGKALFSLINRLGNESARRPMSERGRYTDLFLRALDAYLSRHPRAAGAPRAHYFLASTLADLGSGLVPGRTGVERRDALARAVGELDLLIERYPGTEHERKALLLKGDILLSLLKKWEEALEVYKIGMQKSFRRSPDFAGRIAKTYLVLEKFDQAKSYLEHLVSSNNKELRETGLFYKGMLLGLRGDYGASMDMLTSLAEGNPSSAYANDAIDLAWIIREGTRGDPGVLSSILDGVMSELAGDTAKAIERLERIAKMPVRVPLRPRALFRLGRLYCEGGAFGRALAIYRGFLDDYPEDVLVPDVHRRIAWAYEHGLGQKDKAMEEYEHVLLVYPQYVFLDEVRREVERLRSKGEGRGGE